MRMKITMLGTGHAGVTECYNTCFVLEDHGEKMLVDGGGGNGLLRQLNRAGIGLREIGSIFVTHKHLDHITGILWILRRIHQSARHDPSYKKISIYSHAEVITILRESYRMLLLGEDEEPDDVAFVTVADGEQRQILGDQFTFFDVGSKRVCQYGFRAETPQGISLVCLGDEFLQAKGIPYAQDCTWLMYEAFCAEADKDLYSPHRMNHSTVKDACENAKSVNAENLILYHTEDQRINERKQLYGDEAALYFGRRCIIPDDLETIDL